MYYAMSRLWGKLMTENCRVHLFEKMLLSRKIFSSSLKVECHCGLDLEVHTYAVTQYIVSFKLNRGLGSRHYFHI